jgi:hypothetical protein
MGISLKAVTHPSTDCPDVAALLCSKSDTGRIYIKGYLYPILYPKISKKDISYPFLEQDILRI